MKQLNLVATFVGGTVLFVFALTCWLFEDRLSDSPIFIAPSRIQSETVIRELLRRPTTMARIVPKSGPAVAELAGVPVSTTR